MFERNDFSVFVGGWSYEGESLYRACNSLETNSLSKLSVLEFGCGDSTIKLYNILKSKLQFLDVEYDCYENDPVFAVVHPNIVCSLYHKDSIDSVTLPSKKYDFVLIDGPHGVDRMKWYAKIKNVVKEGTVILVDDWNHFAEFEQALVEDIGSVWNYDVVVLADHAFPVKSYKVVKLISKK